MKLKDIAIKGGTVIDPSQKINGKRDILISGGVIKTVAKDIDAAKTDVIDASGKLVMPGLIDMHVHLREPGGEEAETIMSGCEAAARGGFTAICAMPNTSPPTDDAGRIRYIIEKAENAKARVYPVGAITRGREGSELVEMREMVDAGAVGFSDDGCSVANAAVMLNAMRYADMIGKPVIAHEEDPDLDYRGQMNEGVLSAELGLKGMPGIAEDTFVMRDIAIAEYTRTAIHITHISTKETVQIIRAAKARGVRVTCDVTPHHFALTEELVATFDTRYKMNPPLRAASDVAAIIEGLSDGTIDVIATDHAPHYIEKKELEFIYAAFGVTGLETALGVAQFELVDTKKLSWSDIVRTMSQTPAKILGVDGGTLKEGAAADVTVYDPKSPWTVDSKKMKSKSTNTAFFGRTLPGQVTATVVGGMVYINDME
ncbi:dihydroorotase [Candidatus Latescibacterota bacterium]